MESASLFFKDAGSDKVYLCSIEEVAGGCLVQFSFGRRGSTLQTGSKTPSPIPYDKAKALFDKLVREKTSKGYRPGTADAPAPYVNAGTANDTGIHCQLLNPIDETETDRLIKDPAFGAQEKFDGKRMLLRREGGKVTAINRKGLECGFPADLEKEIQQRTKEGDFIVDGECVGETFYAFDCLKTGEKDLRGLGYETRYSLLCTIIPATGKIRLAELTKTESGKAGLLWDLMNNKREGIVFKRLDAPYVAGRPASGGNQLKYKFYATASCIVKEPNGTKRSVSLELLDGGKRVGVGNCTIPPNKVIPQAGEIVEIRYLYAFRGGSLYQPTFIGIRDDIDSSACVLSQLKFKNEGEEEA